MAEPRDGPLVKGSYDPIGHEIARNRMRSAILDCREFILITRSPADTVTFVSCTHGTGQMLEAALEVHREIQRRKP